ncbi:MAG TPA: transposase [Ignavibacteriaceae bacterium]|nr:transposase [Ignavibacteriaceae bacterium]
MKIRKTGKTNKPMHYVESQFYEYYVAIDWSSTVMTIARMRSNSIEPKVNRDLPAKLKIIKEYIKQLSGKIILTIEETTGAQWLYVELKDYVDKIIICDPYRNSLLKEGPKNDHKDAAELCRLLRAGLLKEVYHSNDENYKIRKLVSSYNDLIKAAVRAKNQLSSIYRGYGLNYKKDELKTEDQYIKHIVEEKLRAIDLYEDEKKKYLEIFKQLEKKNKTIKNLMGISGIDKILAVKIFSIVIDASRFEDKYKYWSYCGLVKYKMESGGRFYGKKNTKYSRELKASYKTATQAALRGNNDIREYYERMLKEGISDRQARSTLCRYIAKSTYAMMRNGTEYKSYNWRKKQSN